MDEENLANKQSLISYGEGHNSDSAMLIRLDTAPLLQQIEYALRGIHESIEIVKGVPHVVAKETGRPLLNVVGVQSVMAFLRSILNTAVVQGNLTEETYGDFMKWIHESIALDLMLNLKPYGLSEDNYGGVMATIIGPIRPFMTRLINNLERVSYNATIRTTESNTSQLKTKGGFNPFSKGT